MCGHTQMLAIAAAACVGLTTFVNALPLNNTMLKRQSTGVYSACGGSGQYAITFDDGPYQWQSDTAGQLSSAGAGGTYFLNGQNYGCIYDYAEQMQAAFSQGHVLGSHTWGHEDISQLSDQQLEDNLSRVGQTAKYGPDVEGVLQVEEAFQKILGVKPALFRPPYGSYNQANLNVLARRGYSVILWNTDTGDSTGGSSGQAQAAFDNAANNYPNAGISLSHETHYSSTHENLQYAIGRLGGAGFQLLTASDCLGIAAYQEYYTDQLPQRDSSWVC